MYKKLFIDHTVVSWSWVDFHTGFQLKLYDKICSQILKGLCHPRRMRVLMRSTLKSLAHLGEFRKLFSSVWIFGKLAEIFIYKRSLVITEAVCWDILAWKLLRWRKSKNPGTNYMQICLNRTLLRMCHIWHSPFKFDGWVRIWSQIASRDLKSDFEKVFKVN